MLLFTSLLSTVALVVLYNSLHATDLITRYLNWFTYPTWLNNPRTAMTNPRIGIVLGSIRTPSNTLGLSAHIEALLQARPVDVQVIHLSKSTEAGQPLPLDIGRMPKTYALSDLPDAYADANVRTWSRTVLALDAVILLSPQFNSGMPAPLKNAIDQLYWEWAGLPAALITTGGGGGARLQEYGRPVLKAVGMDVVEKEVRISLEQKYTRAVETVKGHEEWLDAYDDEINGVVDQLLAKVETTRGKRVV
jgi:NAD(P)H-dependent FMN reductase